MGTRKLGFTALMTAIYSRLDTHASTTAYNTYNYVPDNTALPYITIGEPMGVRSFEYGNRDYDPEDNVVTIHVFSKYKGDKECADMMDDIVQAMTSSALSVTGYTNMEFLFDWSNITVDTTEPAYPVRHGICRFRTQMVST